MAQDKQLYERDPEAWDAHLAEGNARQPRKRVAADVIVRDPDDRVLLVKPQLQARWDVHGGMAEANEPPIEAAARELREELGLSVENGRAALRRLERPLRRSDRRTDHGRGISMCRPRCQSGRRTMKLDHERATQLGVSPDALAKPIQHQRAAVSQRAASVHGGEAELDLAGRTVFLVDEALDSGIVAATAAESLRQRGCDRIIVAVPVADRACVRRVCLEADDVIAVLTPGSAGPRSDWYRQFPAVSDADIAETLTLG
jgi:hypothetical protein